MGPVGRMCGFSDAADAPDSGSRHFSLGGGGDAAVYNIPKRTLIRDQQSEMTFFAHLMLFRNLISSVLSSSRVRHPPRPWEVGGGNRAKRYRWYCRRMAHSSPSWGPRQSRNHPQGLSRVFPVLRSRDTKKHRGRAPLSAGLGPLDGAVRMGLVSGRVGVAGFPGGDWMEIWAIHPHMQPYSFDGTRLGLVVRRRQPRAAPREWHSIHGCCFWPKRKSTCCVTDLGMMFGCGQELLFFHPFLRPVLPDGQQHDEVVSVYFMSHIS